MIALPPRLSTTAWERTVKNIHLATSQSLGRDQVVYFE